MLKIIQNKFSLILIAFQFWDVVNVLLLKYLRF